MAEPTTPHEDDTTPTRAVAVTSAGAAVLFLLLRVLAISDWNWHTAFAVVHTVNFEDAIGIVFGTLMANQTLTGILLVGLVPLAVIHAAWPPSGHRRTPGGLILAATTLTASIALATTAHQWWLPAGAVVVAVGIVAARLLWKRGVGHDAIIFAVRKAGAATALAALALAAVVQTPWMPLERIETEQGTLTGYVLATDPGFVKVLTEGDREILILNQADIVSREELVEH